MRAAAYVLCSMLLGVGFAVMTRVSWPLGVAIVGVAAFTLAQVLASGGPRGPHGRHRR